MSLFDVIIIGGGPAGLNAAVVLGRCQRKVLLFDAGRQRNLHSQGLHNYLTRDNILPRDFIRAARAECRDYGVRFSNTTVVKAKRFKQGFFTVKDNQGSSFHAKKLLIATGLADNRPPLEGINKFYGRSVFHCPYCDGWEVKGKKTGIYAQNKNGFGLAILLTTWNNSVTYYSGERNYLSKQESRLLQLYKIPVITDPLVKLEGVNGKLRKVITKANKDHPCESLFFVNGYSKQSHLVEELGCRLDNNKVVITNRHQQTNIAGVYVAGDASKDMHFVVVAAGEGAKAGVTINKELLDEELTRKKIIIINQQKG